VVAARSLEVLAAVAEVASRLASFVVRERTSLVNNPLQSEHENEGSVGSSPHASERQRCALLPDVIDAPCLKLAAALKLHVAQPSLDRWLSTERCVMKCRHSSLRTT
jgi:hypothetical protein